MRLYNWWAAALAAALVFGGCGCGGSGLVNVKGIVTLDGEPLEGASVVFTPVDKATGHQATGFTDPDGSFRLTTYKEDDGALAGDYIVTVQYGEAPQVSIDPGRGVGKRKSMQGMMIAARGKKKTASKSPAKYRDPAHSILKQHVPPDGPVKLELTSH